MPVHLITADQSHFYKQGLPEGMKKIYAIDFSVVKRTYGSTGTT